MSAIDDVQAVETAWTTGIVIEKSLPTPDTVELRMHVEDRQRHWPGQHYLIRLRAPDDYTAQRSYSVGSDDDDPLVEFLVERLPDGEVSMFLADEAEVGDVLEMRGRSGGGSRGTCARPASAWSAAPVWCPRVDAPHCPPARPHRPPAGGGGRPRPKSYRRRRAGPRGRPARLHPARPRTGPPAPPPLPSPLLDGVDLAYVCALGPVRVVRRDTAGRLRCRAAGDPRWSAVRADRVVQRSVDNCWTEVPRLAP